MKTLIVTLSFFMCCQLCAAQADNTHIDTNYASEVSLALLAGYNYYGRSGVELGITKKIVGGHIAVAGGVDASMEVFRNQNWFIGPKVGFWVAGGFAWGMHLIYYTDFHRSSLQFRPAAGVGFDRFFFFYGWNVRITNKDFNPTSTNMFGMNFFFDVKKYWHKIVT